MFSVKKDKKSYEITKPVSNEKIKNRSIVFCQQKINYYLHVNYR